MTVVSGRTDAPKVRCDLTDRPTDRQTDIIERTVSSDLPSLSKTVRVALSLRYSPPSSISWTTSMLKEVLNFRMTVLLYSRVISLLIVRMVTSLPFLGTPIFISGILPVGSIPMQLLYSGVGDNKYCVGGSNLTNLPVTLTVYWIGLK